MPPGPRGFDPWALPAPKRPVDPARRGIGFETPRAARAERDLRVVHLRRASIPGALRLAVTLAKCRPDARCRSAACPICCRRFRRWWTGAVLTFFRDVPGLVHVTLVHAGDAVGPSGLAAVSPGRLADATRQRLRRAGVGGVVLGGLDGDFDPANGVWQPHFHFLGAVDPASGFDALRGEFPSGGRVYRPVLVQPVGDRAAQASYGAKSYWPQRQRYLDRNGDERTRKRRLDEALHVAWLLWRARFSFTDFLFLQGVRRYGHELRPVGRPTA